MRWHSPLGLIVTDHDCALLAGILGELGIGGQGASQAYRSGSGARWLFSGALSARASRSPGWRRRPLASRRAHDGGGRGTALPGSLAQTASGPGGGAIRLPGRAPRARCRLRIGAGALARLRRHHGRLRRGRRPRNTRLGLRLGRLRRRLGSDAHLRLWGLRASSGRRLRLQEADRNERLRFLPGGREGGLTQHDQRQGMQPQREDQPGTVGRGDHRLAEDSSGWRAANAIWSKPTWRAASMVAITSR